MAPGTEFARDFCAGIGPLQLGVVLVYFLVESFTSVCTCLPVYVHVYQCVYMFTSVCKCLSSWSGPINRYAYIRNTDTKYIFPTDITIENKYMCVCVWVFFSVSFLDLCGRKRRFPANRQAGRQNRHQTWEWIQRVPPFSVSWVSFFNLWSWSATLFDCCCSFKSPRLSCLLLGPQAASNSSNI